MVEIKTDLRGVMDIHPRAAAALGVTYAGVMAEAVDVSDNPADLLNADLVCDPAAVRAAIVDAMRTASAASH